VTHQAYARAKDLDQLADDEVRPWLRGFVREEGLAVAGQLLEGVGELE